MILVNGKASEHISAADRGLHYGDGVFETLVYKDGKIRALKAHLIRLEEGATQLKIPMPDIDVLTDELQQVASAESETQSGDAVLKIILTRGAGGRGYRPSVQPQPTRIISRHALATYPKRAEEGVAVRICAQRLVDNPTLAGMKHLNRLEQVLARMEWDDDEITEGLMCNAHGDIVEGTSSNVFIVESGVLITPPVDRCGVAGIVRAELFEIAHAAGIPCHQRYISPAEFAAADEAFICNSVNGIWPVRQLEDSPIALGAVTRLLQTQLTAMESVG